MILIRFGKFMTPQPGGVLVLVRPLLPVPQLPALVQQRHHLVQVHQPARLPPRLAPVRQPAHQVLQRVQVPQLPALVQQLPALVQQRHLPRQAQAQVLPARQAQVQVRQQYKLDNVINVGYIINIWQEAEEHIFKSSRGLLGLMLGPQLLVMGR
ncbi:MAG: hypothetical protein [Podoviridae sp. ctg2L5]|nr:MAG: hypothetical protein [Podoviridae sp. ctg2L5]